MPILWVVDAEGKFWFSIEEIVNSTTREFVLPRLRNFAVVDGSQRLGHPALIGGAAGRIGGEIIFDLNSEPSAWYITNASGRYGMCNGRTEEHLSNASENFSEYGIRLKEAFYPTRGPT